MCGRVYVFLAGPQVSRGVDGAAGGGQGSVGFCAAPFLLSGTFGGGPCARGMGRAAQRQGGRGGGCFGASDARCRGVIQLRVICRGLRRGRQRAAKDELATGMHTGCGALELLAGRVPLVSQLPAMQ